VPARRTCDDAFFGQRENTPWVGERHGGVHPGSGCTGWVARVRVISGGVRARALDTLPEVSCSSEDASGPVGMWNGVSVRAGPEGAPADRTGPVAGFEHP
jgi:hypothetical protein